MKSSGVVVVLGQARGHGEDVGVEDDVLGREALLLDQDAPGPADRSPRRRSRVSAWPFSSKAMTMAAAP